MRILTLVGIFCLIVAISAKKQHKENLDTVETESKDHGAKKYSKEHQKSHHHSHKHKKPAVEELVNEAEPQPKKAPVEVPEPEITLQENIETSKKAVAQEKHKEQTEDLHLQDLTYEENLKKEKKKKGHHGAHYAEVVKDERKLFSDHESKHNLEEKVIEDSFEPLNERSHENGKKNKGKDKKSKDKSKNKKKAYEKSKSKNGKKSKDGKKNKDKKNNKDRKKN